MDNKNIHILEINNKEIVLIGTAHVSKESAQLVEDTIREYNPDTICIELDDDRLNSLQNPTDWKNTDIKDVIKNKKSNQLLATLMLSSYQQRMANQLGTSVGQEMITAINLSEELGIPLNTIDRNVNVTFKRIWNSLNLKDKTDLLYYGLGSIFEDEELDLEEDDLKAMLEEDVLTASLNEIREHVPTIATILVDERDQFLANKIKNAPGNRVIAVVGGAHVPGIKDELNKEQNMQEINSIPQKKSSIKYINYFFMALILLVLILPFTKGLNEGLNALLRWSLFSGSGAAIATLIIGGHPLTALVSFITAPLAAIHPLIAVGFIAALCEASIRKPKVSDIDNLNEDIKSFKGWRKNRFIRVLALVFIANLGSVIGQFIGGTSIITRLLK